MPGSQSRTEKDGCESESNYFASTLQPWETAKRPFCLRVEFEFKSYKISPFPRFQVEISIHIVDSELSRKQRDPVSVFAPPEKLLSLRPWSYETIANYAAKTQSKTKNFRISKISGKANAVVQTNRLDCYSVKAALATHYSFKISKYNLKSQFLQ